MQFSKLFNSSFLGPKHFPGKFDSDQLQFMFFPKSKRIRSTGKQNNSKIDYLRFPNVDGIMIVFKVNEINQFQNLFFSKFCSFCWYSFQILTFWSNLKWFISSSFIMILLYILVSCHDLILRFRQKFLLVYRTILYYRLA